MSSLFCFCTGAYLVTGLFHVSFLLLCLLILGPYGVPTDIILPFVEIRFRFLKFRRRNSG